MRLFLLFLFPLLFTGCFSSFPLNLSEEEYNKLSFEQKIKLREYQAKLDNKRAIEQLKNQREYNQQQHDLALKMQENLQQLHQSSKEVLYVNIHSGYFDTMKKGYTIQPFTIRPYEVKKIAVYSNSHYVHHYLWVTLQEEGFYIGITPNKNYQHLVSYQSNSNNILKSFYPPTIIAYSPKWKREHSYIISLKNHYKAHHLKVTLFLKERKQRDTFYR